MNLWIWAEGESQLFKEEKRAVAVAGSPGPTGKNKKGREEKVPPFRFSGAGEKPPAKYRAKNPLAKRKGARQRRREKKKEEGEKKRQPARPLITYVSTGTLLLEVEVRKRKRGEGGRGGAG